MRKDILFLCFLLSSCGAVTQEELDARLAQINKRIEKLEEEQQTIKAQQINTEERVDALSQNLASLKLEVEKLKVEGTTKPESAKVEEKSEREPSQPKQFAQKSQERQRCERTISPDYEREYKSALNLYNLRQLNQAKEKFIAFIKNHPKTSLTDNAYLWLGVIYRDLGDKTKAQEMWHTLEEKCKKGEMVDCNKLPSAYLQLAKLYEAQGNSEKAKEYYEAILKEFPLSEEAELAKKKLGR
jgi:TolA-binding protein